MLLFDAGNSRCKWAWVENGIWLRQGMLGNTDTAAWQNLKNTFTQLESPQKILVSNVAGAAMAQRLRELDPAAMGTGARAAPSRFPPHWKQGFFAATQVE